MNLDRVIAVRNTKTVYRDGERCIKVFNGEYSKEDVLNEALNQARAEKMGFRVPKILEVTVVDGKWAIVSEYIKGRSLSRIMTENPEKTEQYLNMLVGIQLDVQHEKCSLFENVAEKALRGISAVRGAGAKIGDSLKDRLGELAEASFVCHGDFTPSNVLVAEDDTLYILDWDNASRGNAAVDAASTYLMFRRSGDISADRYIELYCEKSGIERDEIDRWIPVAAASQYAMAKSRARRFLLSWIR